MPLQEKLTAGEFVILAEMEPPKGTDVSDMVAGATSVKRMVDVLGVANASELFYTARVCDAQNALKIGLVSSVQDDCFLHAAETAAQISANAPLTIAAAKLAFLTVLAGSTETDAETVALAVKACFESQDYTEGRQAFAEKRPARFVGR